MKRSIFFAALLLGNVFSPLLGKSQQFECHELSSNEIEECLAGNSRESDVQEISFPVLITSGPRLGYLFASEQANPDVVKNGGSSPGSLRTDVVSVTLKAKTNQKLSIGLGKVGPCLWCVNKVTQTIVLSQDQITKWSRSFFGDNKSWDIVYLGSDGFLKRFTFYSTVSDREKEVDMLLESVSGSKSGSSKEGKYLMSMLYYQLNIYDNILNPLEDKLFVIDEKKPWCNIVKKAKFPRAYEVYKVTSLKANNVRSSLQLDPRRAASTYSWKDYLDSNPSKKAWANANPSLAASFKLCSSLSSS